MNGSLLFLGTGGSAGIPFIGCACPVCTSDDPLNKRLRPSALIEVMGKKFLIDTGPDYRLQALKYHINHIDGVLLTHTHFDHVAGLDELRTYYLLSRQIIPLLVSKTSLKNLKERYPYLFKEKNHGDTLSAQLEFHLLAKERGVTEFLGIPIQHMTFSQGGMQVTGYRFGDLAYISDIHDYPETIFADLQGVETLIISALRDSPSAMHLSIEEAIAFSKKIGATRTFFTHVSHEIDHQTTNASMPAGFELAHDGLTLPFTLL